jgi:hypothetical protein
MILPSKHLRQDRSLIGVGAEILTLLERDRTVSSVWERVKSERGQNDGVPGISFDWFVLALDFLFTAGAVDFVDGRLRRVRP